MGVRSFAVVAAGLPCNEPADQRRVAVQENPTEDHAMFAVAVGSVTSPRGAIRDRAGPARVVQITPYQVGPFECQRLVRNDKSVRHAAALAIAPMVQSQ